MAGRFCNPCVSAHKRFTSGRSGTHSTVERGSTLSIRPATWDYWSILTGASGKRDEPAQDDKSITFGLRCCSWLICSARANKKLEAALIGQRCEVV